MTEQEVPEIVDHVVDPTQFRPLGPCVLAKKQDSSFNGYVMVFQLSSADSARPTVYEHLKRYMATKGIENGLFLEDGLVVLAKNKEGHRFSFRQAMSDVKKALECLHPPRRIRVSTGGVEKFVSTLFADGYDEDVVKDTVGIKFSPEALTSRLSVSSQQAKRNTAVYEAETTTDAVREGLVPIFQASSVKTARSIKDEEDREKEMRARPPFPATIPLRFHKWREGEPVYEDEEDDEEGHHNDSLYPKKKRRKRDRKRMHEKVVHFVPMTEDTRTKLKHLFVYSTMAGYGKTTTVANEIVDKYSAVFVNDANNGTNIPKGVKVLVFDEFKGNKTMSLESLRAITSGNASRGAINRKSYGESYEPAKDAQVIILSNMSPYQMYGEYDRTLMRNVMSEETLSTITDRFHIHCLNDVDEDERLKYLSPEAMDREHLLLAIERHQREALRGLEEIEGVVTGETVVDTVRNVITMHNMKRKEVTHMDKAVLDALLLPLFEGMAWRPFLDIFSAGKTMHKPTKKRMEEVAPWVDALIDVQRKQKGLDTLELAMKALIKKYQMDLVDVYKNAPASISSRLLVTIVERVTEMWQHANPLRQGGDILKADLLHVLIPIFPGMSWAEVLDEMGECRAMTFYKGKRMAQAHVVLENLLHYQCGHIKKEEHMQFRKDRVGDPRVANPIDMGTDVLSSIKLFDVPEYYKAKDFFTQFRIVRYYREQARVSGVRGTFIHKVCRFMAKMHNEEGAKDETIMRLVISPMVPMLRHLEDERVLKKLLATIHNGEGGEDSRGSSSYDDEKSD